MVHSPNFFPRKVSNIFHLRVRLLCVALTEQLGDDSYLAVCAACCHMALAFAMNFYNVY